MANLLLFLTFSLLFLPFSISSSSKYTFPSNYFINCGSNSPIVVIRTNFSRDLLSNSRESHSVKDPTTTTELAGIYQTARKFTKSDSYKLQIEENGVYYMVRLHFFPFFSLVGAKFNVSASGFLLLSNFSIPRNLTSPVMKEFLVPVVKSSTNLEIIFRPDPSSFAFVNAIEAFVTPQGFIPNSSVAHVTPRGNGSRNDGGKDLSSNVLTVIHRINVGGSDISPGMDTMMRNWVADDEYLFNKSSAKNHSIYSSRPNYDQGGGATEYDAPDSVYRTAKEMNTDVVEDENNFFNITWLFGVKRNAAFFVRLHFCDIVSENRNVTVFDVYLYGLYGRAISPYDTVQVLAAPFYVDFLVDSDGSGFMNISVGPRNDSKSKNAFLNGVEIMELINDRDEWTDDENKNNLWIIVGPVVGGVVLIVVLSVVVVLFCLKSRKTKPDENSNWPVVSVYAGSTPSRTTVRTPIGSTTPDINLGLKIPFAEILYATNKFDPKFMIGEGGFGKVYKGTLHNGVKVAVKRSEAGHGQGLMEFQTEIILLSKIRHQHLVSLIGYCDERYEMILVYEFMEKGTLREHLYSSNEDLSKSSSRSELSWDQRLQICIGAANGLQYLHTGLSEPIIHRDIKSTNILLDEHYVAKVADFGLSKSGAPEETHIVTDVKGSFGYLDPEYMKSMQLTQKSDVYSFGVVLLEVLCARPAVDNLLPRNQINLAEWGLSCLKENMLETIVDPFLAGKINPNSVRKFVETAEKCLQENGTDRPNMTDVLWDLNYARQLQHPAKYQESHEDSTTDVSWQLALPGINRLPSMDLNTSCVSVSESDVFSQLRMNESR